MARVNILIRHLVQELSSILDLVRGAQGAESSGPAQAAESSGPAEGSGGPGKSDNSVQQGRGLQTFVFSATLTLPEALRKRVKKGGEFISPFISK